MWRQVRPIFLVLLLSAPLAPIMISTFAQDDFSKMDREDDRSMLRDALDALKKHYYDTKFHGLDIDKLYTQYDEKMKSVRSNRQAFTIVAGFLENLDDSHTFFNPPLLVTRFDYDYEMQMIGDKCFVTHVRPGSDAASKLHPGDEILKRENYVVNRKDIFTMIYFFQTLDPTGQSELDIQDPSGQQRHVEVKATTHEGSKIGEANLWDLSNEEYNEIHANRDRLVEKGDLTIWRFPWFFDNDEVIDQHFATVRKHQGLILDLRGNPGGSGAVLSQMLGYLFDRDVKIADRASRKESKPLMAKSRGGAAFSGKVIVLVDSNSASAAELFARVVQLEKRGIVLGERSSGRVMQARVWPYQAGGQVAKLYDFEVTDADLIMKDGKSLEKEGVMPVATIIPTAADLAAGRDPVLSQAAALLGATIDPTDAGKLFPYEWVTP